MLWECQHYELITDNNGDSIISQLKIAQKERLLIVGKKQFQCVFFSLKVLSFKHVISDQ